MKTRPPECCGVCPETETGCNCTCAGNPRCVKPENDKEGVHYMNLVPEHDPEQRQP